MAIANKVIISLLALTLGISVILNFHFRARLCNIPRESYIDTIKVSVPIPRDSVVLKYETVYLPIVPDTVTVNDTVTITQHDSIRVSIPISQKIYEEEEYTAWISGYHASLDSLELHIPTTVITRTEKTPWFELSAGLQGGATWIPQQGIRPYIGIGIQIGIPFRKIKEIRKHRRR